MAKSNNVIVVSAPSGGGKGSILKPVVNADDRLVHSVSVTTRGPRDNEVDGVEYTFVTPDAFKASVEADEFLEWAEVHENFYGTLRSEIEKHDASGEDVVLELDVQGKRNLLSAKPNAKTVFVMPPSLKVLEERLRARGGLTEPELQTRLANAKEEMAASGEYDYVIVNDKLEDAIAQFIEILKELRQD
ncbi:MAG: guanylate kinase [Candidatus Hydrogenedentota bacterium]